MRKSPFGALIAAVGAISISALAALALATMHVEAPYLMLLLGALGAVIVGGPGAGLIAVLLSTFVTWFFFIPPVWSFELPSVNDTITVLLFLAVVLASTRLYDRQRKIIDELNAANFSLRQQLLRMGRPGLGA